MAVSDAKTADTDVARRPGLGRNSAWSTATYLVGSVAGLVTIPVLLSHLGTVQFGLYVIVQTVVAYASLARMGLGSGFVQGFAGAMREPRRYSVEGMLGTGVAILGAISVLLIMALTAASGLLATVFKVPSGIRTDFIVLIAGAATAFGLATMQSPFAGLLNALERVDIVAKLDLFTIVAGAAAAIAVVVCGGQLRHLALAMVAVSATSLLLAVIICRKTRSEQGIRRMRLERSSLGFLWRYGIRIQVTLISGLVNRSIDRLWLGAIQSPTAVTVYDVADRAAYSFVYLAHPVTNALTPRFAALSVDAAQGREWCRLYRTSTQVTALFAGSLAALVFVCAPWLLRAWLGVIHPDSLYSLRVLALGYGVLVSFAPASVAARAQSVPRLAARLAVGFTVVNVLASLGGVLVAGVRGAATASAACGVLYGLAYPLFVEGRILDTRLGTGLRMALPAWLPSMLAGAAVWIGLLTIPGSAHASSRLNALAVLVVAGCVFVFVLFLSASVTRTLPKPLVDRAIMLARSARGRIRRRGTKPDNHSSSNDSESV